jgi:hypothetical protein
MQVAQKGGNPVRDKAVNKLDTNTSLGGVSS